VRKIAAKRDELIAKEKAKSDAEKALVAPPEGGALRAPERRRRRTEAAAE
jgi:DNA-directed RNA polymerase subunit beta'